MACAAGAGGRIVKLPAEPPIESLTAIIDNREQCPLDLSPLKTKRGTLDDGDYTLVGLEKIAVIERKSEPDFLMCCGPERERFFDRNVPRLLGYPVKALVIESSWAALERGGWRSRITPAQAIGSLLGLIAMGLPVVLAYDHQRAGSIVARILFIAARRRWREARALVSDVTGAEPSIDADGQGAAA